jgi:hypothetical protein
VRNQRRMPSNTIYQLPFLKLQSNDCEHLAMSDPALRSPRNAWSVHPELPVRNMEPGFVHTLAEQLRTSQKVVPSRFRVQLDALGSIWGPKRVIFSTNSASLAV